MVVTPLLDGSDAVLARLEAYAAAEGVSLRAYHAGEVPESPALPYVAVWTWQRTDGSIRRISDDSLTRPFRTVTQFVGETRWEAQIVEQHVDAALRGYRLQIADTATTPCHHEAEAGVSRDSDLEDLFVGSCAWTWCATLDPAA